MFNILCKFRNKGLLNGRDSTTVTTILCFFQTPVSRRSISTNIDTNTNKFFTVSYLINSCGLSQTEALTISNKIQLKTSSKPDSVLTLFRNYGLTNTLITKFILGRPKLLLSDPIKSLKPKFEFLHSIGLSGTQLTGVLYRNPNILYRSLENHIIPSIDFLKTIVHTDANVIKVLTRGKWVLHVDLQKQLTPKIACLQAHGVPISNIATLLTRDPFVFLQSLNRFNEVVKKTKEMGFDPMKFTFLLGVCGLSVSKPVWEEKINVYRKWGWSEEEIRKAFVKQPNCMACSENKINQVMDFLVNKMGYDSSLMARNPSLIALSLEKRIIPRCSVLHVLISIGLVEKDCSLNSVMLTSEMYFLKNFVTKFDKQVPELLDLYQGKVNGVLLPDE